MPEITTWCTIQVKCAGTDGDVLHDQPCPGGEWTDLISLGWFNDNPEGALAIFREDCEDPANIRIVRRTEEVLDL